MNRNSLRRRWLPISVVLLVLCGISVRQILKNRAQAKRETGYQSILRAYTQDLKPGMKRQQVEDHLHARNMTFRQMCCVDRSDASVWDDLIKIGDEDVPRVCSQNNVYIALDFVGQPKEVEHVTNAYPDDVLKAVTVYHHLEGCL